MFSFFFVSDEIIGNAIDENSTNIFPAWWMSDTASWYTRTLSNQLQFHPTPIMLQEKYQHSVSHFSSDSKQVLHRKTIKQ